MDKKMSIEEAKDFFLSMDCSTFVMARENLPKYNQYKHTGIPKQTEILWKEERLYAYFLEIKSNTTKDELWLVFNKMYDLAESLRNHQSIKIMLDVINMLFYIDLRVDERIIISETIIGRMHRSQRSGLIYLSYDMGLKSYSESFAALSLKLLEIYSNDSNLVTRADSAKRNCIEIAQELEIYPKI